MCLLLVNVRQNIILDLAEVIRGQIAVKAWLLDLA